MENTDHGRVATVLESNAELQTMFLEVQEYFDAGASLSRGATVLDVGANIGTFAISAAKRCEGDVRLFCFEPVPPLFGALERNLRENQWLTPGTHRAFNMALSTPEEAGIPCDFYYFRRFPRDSTMDIEQKRAEFEEFFAVQGARAGRAVRFLGPGAKLIAGAVSALPRGPAGRWLSDKVTGLEKIKVARSTLTDVLSKEQVPQIDLLKLDVEGAEDKVLAGIDDSLWGRIQQVVVESDGAEEHTRALVSLLEGKGLTVRVLSSPSMVERGLKNVLIYASR